MIALVLAATGMAQVPRDIVITGGTTLDLFEPTWDERAPFAQRRATQRRVDKAVARLRADPTLSLLVETHHRSTAWSTIRSGPEAATSVERYVEAAGIDSSRVAAVNHGGLDASQTWRRGEGYRVVLRYVTQFPTLCEAVLAGLDLADRAVELARTSRIPTQWVLRQPEDGSALVGGGVIAPWHPALASCVAGLAWDGPVVSCRTREDPGWMRAHECIPDPVLVSTSRVGAELWAGAGAAFQVSPEWVIFYDRPPDPARVFPPIAHPWEVQAR